MVSKKGYVGIMAAYNEINPYVSLSTTNIGGVPEINFDSTSSISVKVSKASMTTEPVNYSVTYYKTDANGVMLAGTSQTVTKTVNPFTIDSLATNQSYGISIKAWDGTRFGNIVYRSFTTPIEYNVAGYTGVVVNTTQAAAAKSFLRMSNNSNSPKEYSVAYRTFQSITLPTVTSSYSGLPSYIQEAIDSYSTSYYAFGTKMFLESIIDKTKQSAGFGFFVDGQGNNGYYVLIDSTETAGAVNKKEVRICKVKGGDIRVLNDTQKNTVTTLNGVYGGRAYDIDIKVQVNLSTVKINVYVNGFLISATDSTGVYEDDNGKSSVNQILKPTKTISVVCKYGEAMFDYVYGTDISAKAYKDSEFVNNMYRGSFSNDYLNLGFGDIIYNNSIEDDNNLKPAALDEFGTSVREIRKVSLRYNSAPAYPIKFSTGLNTSVKILGSRLSNFGGETYVLNNSAALTPLNDEQSATFYLYGDTIAPSGTLEYNSDILSDYINQEPVVFESSWLQNLSDVEALGQWIKNNIVNKGKLINLSIFGNPFIAVGDIVSVKYSYQGLDGTQKFIVTNVRHSFNEGLDTEITCRSL
jgi:hypothetical protein